MNLRMLRLCKWWSHSGERFTFERRRSGQKDKVDILGACRITRNAKHDTLFFKIRGMPVAL